MNRFLTIFSLVVMSCFAGCETMSGFWNNITGGNNQGEAEFRGEMAEYVSEVAKARPGILLGISVTAAGSPAFESRTYLV